MTRCFPLVIDDENNPLALGLYYKRGLHTLNPHYSLSLPQVFPFLPFLARFYIKSKQMDRATRSEGLGNAPFHGVFHTILSIIILGLSAFLFSKFKEGGDNEFGPLRNVYLYDLIVSALAIAGGLLICLPIIGRPIVLAIALLLPLLYIAGFGWTEYEHHVHQQFMPHDGVAIALLVFLGLAAFLGLFAFIAEISMFRHRRATTKGPVV